MRAGRERIVVVSGTFDCIRSSELRYLKQCTLICDWLIAGVHTDKYLSTIESFPNQDYDTRREILLELVDEVLAFDDTDGTITSLLRVVRQCYPGAEIVYASPDDMQGRPETKLKGIKFLTLKQEQ